MANQFGFIITRHVNSETTNQYWNQSVKLIRTLYPLRPIVIIDDNSDPAWLKADHAYANVTTIQSEYPQRGELLPYIYYLKHRWFPSAVILHDSLFIHRRMPFERFKCPVMPLWHHRYDQENLPNIVRLTSALKNNKALLSEVRQPPIGSSPLLSFQTYRAQPFNLCFGGQCYIKLSFLLRLEQKYQLSNLTAVVRNRTDRCSLERVLGLLFCQECPKLMKWKASLFGDILKQKHAFQYTFAKYQEDVKANKLVYPFVKVWTGR